MRGAGRGDNYHLVGKQENDVNRLEVIGVRRRTFYILSLPPATARPDIVGARNQGILRKIQFAAKDL